MLKICPFLYLQAMPVSQPLQRKKSLPDVQAIPIRGDGAMSREEVSVLSSARREEVRRQQDEAEKLRANPLLWLISPQVKVTDRHAKFPITFLILFIFRFFFTIIAKNTKISKNGTLWSGFVVHLFD